MHTPGESPWVVLKFGGTSVSSASKWRIIADVVTSRVEEGLRPVVVQSALSGVSDQLEGLLHEAVAGTHQATLRSIHEQHQALAADLDVPLDGLLDELLSELGQLAAGIALVREFSPRLQARVLAVGELMASLLGAAYLRTLGLDVQWVDARTVLQSETRRELAPRTRILSAECGAEPDAALCARFAAMPGVILTQGFIASDAGGDTVLLGRGGSDTSAAYIACRLTARRLEVWTDVPGMFTADPRLVPSARLLRSLDYGEAQEIATTGGAVLHARCIPAVRGHRIPIHIRSTNHPGCEGTVISALPDEGRPAVKAISVKRNAVLISMETLGMWQQVGFLADAFACFARHGMSIDLVATSETNVTVSLDSDANTLDAAALDELLHDLAALCKARVIAPCAAVSLVGRQIRAILYQLGPALEVFQEQQVHLVTQAASDLNITFVVEEDSAGRLVKRLHGIVVREHALNPAFGPTWEQLSGSSAAAAARHPHARQWWEIKQRELLELMKDRDAAYVYDLETIDRSIERLQAMRSIDRIFYAMKANGNRRVLERMRLREVAFECVSRAEVEHVLALFPGIDPADILFTPNFAPKSEYAFAFDAGVRVTLDNLHPLKQWPELFRGRDVLIRVDPGSGHGHHEKVYTAGQQSKFGIPISEMGELRRLAQCGKARIVGLHAHSGSGIWALEHWSATGGLLGQLVDHFPDVTALNLGGGLGVPERIDQAELDIPAIDRSLAPLKDANPSWELWLEPGRFLVAQGGVLLARVTQIKDKGDVRYIGVSTGMNSLVRPALYGSYHRIVNLTRLDHEATDVVSVVGPICETGDRLGVDHMLPPTKEDDVILIADTGAYGYTMSSHYNMRAPAEEVVL
ncbi:MAG: bifunctional aspartate kinase/diaminopimelate decarboxylase [Gemmatimonadetes bacterium]|nr:bifunctional aspartate kinase/diaminopimelate decarboxylase [Gemmatimonadota bacterium]